MDGANYLSIGEDYKLHEVNFKRSLAINHPPLIVIPKKDLAWSK
jgi:hypothetical protein